MNDFHYVSVLLDLLYGVEIEDQDVEEYGLLAWNLIGNKNRKLYKYCTCINPIDNSVTLPCNAVEPYGQVELVTSSYEDWERVTNKTNFGDQGSAFVENVVEAEKFYQGPYYLPGKVLKYEQVDDKLYFTHNYGRINILYKGYLSDDEGLPKLTDKEATAIATYIAYILKFKEGLITNNQQISQQAILLNQTWIKQCEQARITYLNQNDIDAILEAQSSWDRKRYGKGLKMFK